MAHRIWRRHLALVARTDDQHRVRTRRIASVLFRERRFVLRRSQMNSIKNFRRALVLSLALASMAACRLTQVKANLAPADIDTSLFLIGDACEPDPREKSAALDSLTAQATAAPQPVIVFLGDNVYPDGIPEEGR